MKLTYLAHAAFLIETVGGTRLATDPYEPGGFGGAVGYAPVGVEAEAVLVSHDHADHSAAGEVAGSPRVVDRAGCTEVGDALVRAVATFHDARRGAERGANLVFVVESGGVSIAHLGDLGHPLTRAQADQIGRVDAVLVPVGGTFTIDAAAAWDVVKALGARVAVPMHYKTAKLGFNIDPVTAFTGRAPGWTVREMESTAELGAGGPPAPAAGPPEPPEVWVLRPARL